MSDADFRSLISAIPSYIVAIGALVAGVVAILNYRQNRETVAAAKAAAAEAANAAAEAKKATGLTIQGNAAIDEIGLRVDGRLTALLAANQATADARVQAAGLAGHIEGVTAEQARVAVPETLDADPLPVQIVQVPADAPVRVTGDTA